MARRQPGAAHAEDLQRRRCGETAQQVGAGDPAAPHGLVDHGRQLRDVTGVQVPGIRNAVLNDES